MTMMPEEKIAEALYKSVTMPGWWTQQEVIENLTFSWPVGASGIHPGSKMTGTTTDGRRFEVEVRFIG